MNIFDIKIVASTDKARWLYHEHELFSGVKYRIEQIGDISTWSWKWEVGDIVKYQKGMLERKENMTDWISASEIELWNIALSEI